MAAQTDPSPAPRPPLTRQRVLDTAVELADRDGVGSLSMRKLAQELGVEAMSLYHHVAGKDAILDGLIDIVFSEIELPSGGTDWKHAMRQRACSAREALRRHPWATSLMESRPTPGPANLRHHDAVLGILRNAGFSIELAAHAYSLLDAYIYGFALQEKSVPFEDAEGSTEVAEEQVREFEAAAEERRSAGLEEEFPYLAEVVAGHVAKVGYDFTTAFEYGLDLILDALEKRRDTA
jgi:AcrR family transcriptional regulator